MIEKKEEAPATGTPHEKPTATEAAGKSISPSLAISNIFPSNFFSSLIERPADETILKIKALLAVGKDGRPKNLRENLSIIIEEDPNFHNLVKFDRATGSIKHHPSYRGLDHLHAEIAAYLSDVYGIEMTAPLTEWTIHLIGYRHPFNSVIEAYRALGQAPEENPLDVFMFHLLLKNSETSPAVREIFDLFFKKAALQVLVPEYSSLSFPNDVVPVLQGPQGIGKTLCIKHVAIAPALYYDAGSGSMEELVSRDGLMKIVGLDICEWGEFRAHREVERLKALVSATSFTLRPPYGRAPVTISRTVSHMGSANPTEYLVDGGGNRRFFPISVERIDFALFNEHADIFRQLRAWYRDWALQFVQEAGDNLKDRLFSIHESDDLAAYLEGSREAVRVISPSEDLIEEYVHRVQEAATARDFSGFLNTRPSAPTWKEFYSAIEAAKMIFPSGRIPQDFFRVFSEVMTRHGFQYVNRSIDGKKFRHWIQETGTGNTGTPLFPKYIENNENIGHRVLERQGVPRSAVPIDDMLFPEVSEEEFPK